MTQPELKYLIGQRVILNKFEIGTVVKAENKHYPSTETRIWVMSPSKGYASCYDACNIKPLPNGQL